MRKLKIIIVAVSICCIVCTVLISNEVQTPNKDLNQTTSFCDVNNVNCSTYLAYLEQYGKTPAEYILDKFKYHQIVIIGELHHVQQNLELLHELIPKLYEQAGVRFLGYEFFASSCQEDIDKLVNSKEYDSDLEKHIIRETAIRMGMLWPFQEYVDVFKIVWKLNQGIDDQSKRFRIVFMAPDSNWHDFHYGDKQQKRAMQVELMKGDMYYAEPIMREFDRTGHKGLIWCGTTHAVTRLKGNPRRAPELRCGGHLYKKYGGKVFQIMLHGFWYYRDRPTATDYALDGMLDNVLKEHNKRIGFDIAESPFADIELPKDFIWFIDNPGATFGGYCDGYIWLVPLEEFKANQMMNVAKIVPDEETFRKIIQNFNSKSVQEMKSRQELLAYVRKVEDMFRQYHQTFMPFLSTQSKQKPNKPDID